MVSLASWLSLSGLLADIVGFILIGCELLKAPDRRLFWGPTNRLDTIGFVLVILGFGLQAAGQVHGLLQPAH